MASHPKHWKHRILYVGRDHALLSFLQYTFTECKIVRCPAGRLAQPLIESELPFIGSEIKYSLLLFDEQLPDMTGAELEQFVRSISHREHTPVIIFEKWDNLKTLVDEIMQALG